MEVLRHRTLNFVLQYLTTSVRAYRRVLHVDAKELCEFRERNLPIVVQVKILE